MTNSYRQLLIRQCFPSQSQICYVPWFYMISMMLVKLTEFSQDAGLRAATLLKERPWHRCFPVDFAKFLRTPFFTEHLWKTASGVSGGLTKVRNELKRSKAI